MRDGTKNTLLWAAAGAGACLAARELLRWSRSIDLRGRTAFITGGSRGLGLLLARRLAGEGMRLALCARDPDELWRARDELAGRTDVLALPCDVGDRQQAEEAVRQVIAHFGSLDVLINNAGVIQTGPMEEMTYEDYEEAMRVHYWGPLHATLAALPHMRRRRQGRIVNISSIGGKVSVPHLLPYCGSKSATRCRASRSAPSEPPGRSSRPCATATPR